MSEIYTSAVKNYIQRNGFVMVSNLLFDYQDELGISDLELTFLMRIMKNRKGYSIHDSVLDPNTSSKTLSRRRISLKEKGLINFTVVKSQGEDGKFVTKGISYDLSPLEEKLQKISDRIEDAKREEAEEIISQNEEVLEDSDDDSPLSKYKRDYFNFYGVNCKFTQYELTKYNSLSEENKKLVAYIFEYCKANKLLKKIVPRLALFFQVGFRFADLKKWYLSNYSDDYCEGNDEDVMTCSNDNFVDRTELIDSIFMMFYPSNNKGCNSSFFLKLRNYVYDNYNDEWESGVPAKDMKEIKALYDKYRSKER